MNFSKYHLEQRPNELPNLGVQYLADYFECRHLPESAEELEKIMLEATNIIGATPVKSVFHKYNPYGLSGVVIIAESHFAVHTWPEHKIAAIDLFSCKKIDPEGGLHFIEEKFGAKDMRITGVERGKAV